MADDTCPCFPGTCRGGEVINGRTAAGLRCKSQEVARAFEIADEAMFELIVSHGIPIDTSATEATRFSLQSENYSEVRTLDEACDAMRDAIDWLAPRGYVELARDEHGEHVLVLRRPGE